MRQDLQRIFFALVIVAGIALPLHWAASYSLDELVQINGINGNEIYDKVCKTQSVVNAIAAVQNGYVKQLVTQTIDDFKRAAIDYAAQKLLCEIIPDKTVSAGFLGSGTSFTFKKPSCPVDVGGATVSFLKNQALRRIKSDFLSRCLARQMFSKVEDDFQRIIHENGPDGGEAFVTDYIQLPAIEERRAINRFNAILVNTPICPAFRDRVYQDFEVPPAYIDDPPPIDKDGYKVTAGEPFTVRGACSVPAELTADTLDANFHNLGGFDSVNLLSRPENNYDDFMIMAREEQDAQIAAAVAGAQNEAIAGGGFRGLYKCIRDDGQGHCLQQVVVQPAGAVNNQNLALKQGNIDWITNSQTTNSLTGDIRQRIISGILDINQKAQDIVVQLDSESQELADLGTSTPTPGASDDPNSPENLACTGGNPQCFCVRDDPDLSWMRDGVAEATRAAIVAHPELVSADGSSVLPGQNQNFLTAICETNPGGALGCRASSSQDDEIIVDTGTTTVSVDVITSNGVIRIPGQTVAACQAGVQ